MNVLKNLPTAENAEIAKEKYQTVPETGLFNSNL